MCKSLSSGESASRLFLENPWRFLFSESYCAMKCLMYDEKIDGYRNHMSQILDIHRFLQTIALSSNSFPSKTFQSLKIYWWSHTKTFDFEVYQNYFLEATKNLTKTLVQCNVHLISIHFYVCFGKLSQIPRKWQWPIGRQSSWFW